MADRLVSPIVSRGFDRVLVRAPNLIDPMVSMGFAKDKISVTQSGVRDDFFAPGNGEEFRSKHGLDGEFVLYLGRLNPTKGLRYLVEAAPRVVGENPDTRFVLIGPDEGGHRSELEARIRALGLGENFVFLGPIYDQAQKRAALSACDVFVLPSGYEGTSQAVMQAMAQGAAVVTTTVGGMPFLIDHGFDGILIPFASTQHLSDSLNHLLAHPGHRRRMGERARKRASRQFRYSKLAARLSKIYETVNQASR